MPWDSATHTRAFKHGFVAGLSGLLSAQDTAEGGTKTRQTPGICRREKHLEQRVFFLPIDVVFDMHDRLKCISPIADRHAAANPHLAAKFDRGGELSTRQRNLCGGVDFLSEA
jgi:hypothetical protein